MTADEKYELLNNHLNEWMILEYNLSKDQYGASITSSKFVKSVLLGVMAAAILLSLIAGITMARLIALPIHQSIGVLQRVAEGDLTQEIASSFKDELGQLARSIDTMREKLREMVGQSMSMSMS